VRAVGLDELFKGQGRAMLATSQRERLLNSSRTTCHAAALPRVSSITGGTRLMRSHGQASITSV
jgi:hypothetical protein